MYSGFLQALQNQQLAPSLEDMREFNQIIKERAPLIKKSILEANILQTDEKIPKNESNNNIEDSSKLE